MKTSALTQAGLDRLHQAMAARVENRSLPGIVTLVAQGDVRPGHGFVIVEPTTSNPPYPICPQRFARGPNASTAFIRVRPGA
jgi:hypothetical protein